MNLGQSMDGLVLAPRPFLPWIRRHLRLAAAGRGARTSPECLGFGVIVSLRERDWTNILQNQQGDAKDFPHQLLLGFLHSSEE